MKLRALTLLTCLLAGHWTLTYAADWPQWRGPDRNGVSKETGLLKTWLKDGPPLMWTYKNSGLGYSSFAIVGDRLYTLGAIDEVEYVIALDLKGDKVQEAWKARIGPIFTFDDNMWGDGPRSTSTVDGKHVYALGAQGELVCVDIDKGNVAWRKNLVKDLDGEMMTQWGYSESPLVDGDLVICTPGGDKGTLAALDKKNGEVVWRSKELTNKAPYTSVVAAQIGGVRQYVQLSYVDDVKGGEISGFAAKDGKLLWNHTHFKGHCYSIASMPIVRSNQIYVTVNANLPCHLFDISVDANGKFNVKEVYPKQHHANLRNNHGCVVLIGDYLYGHSNGDSWVCQELKNGEVKWKELDKLDGSNGSITAADGHLYLYSELGEVVLLDATPAAWSEKGRFTIPEKSKAPRERRTGSSGKIWAHPVVANGRLYLRDQELIFCYDVREKK